MADTRRAAETLAAEMKRIGLENVRLIETAHGGAGGASAGLWGVAACGGEADGAVLWALRCAAAGSAG